MDRNEQIAVIGGGPVGMTCALALAYRGLSVTVFEQDDGFCDGSRAICISRRSLQILHQLGAADLFVEKGLHWTEGHSFLGQDEVFHLVMPMGPDDRFPPFVNVQQYYIEEFLYRALDADPRISFNWDAAVTDITPSEDDIDIAWTSAEGERRQSFPWAIACDGAHSTARRLLGLQMQGDARDAP